MCSSSSSTRSSSSSCSLQGCRHFSSSDYLELLWTTLAEFPAVLAALLLSQRFGRRRVMAGCCLLTAGSTFVVGLCSVGVTVQVN